MYYHYTLYHSHFHFNSNQDVKDTFINFDECFNYACGFNLLETQFYGLEDQQPKYTSISKNTRHPGESHSRVVSQSQASSPYSSVNTLWQTVTYLLMVIFIHYL